jgi:hypothetical protein
MYETMAGWETPDVIPDRTPAMLDFARIWQAAGKIVYSKSLETVSTQKTRLEREFDPQVVRDLKAQLPHDAAVGGPTLAAHAIWAGLVDEYHLFVAPIIIGRRQAVPARQRPRKAGTPGRAQFRSWNDPSSLSRADLMVTRLRATPRLPVPEAPANEAVAPTVGCAAGEARGVTHDQRRRGE